MQVLFGAHKNGRYRRYWKSTIKKVQERAAKLIIALKHLPYTETRKRQGFTH